MRIFIDIGHPAHVHYFRNFIRIMEDKGHEFFISARDKEVAHSLLKFYNIDYVNRGKGRKSVVGKIFYIIEADFKILYYAKKFKPDLFLSFGSPYAAHVSKLLRKPHIVFDDTEHAKYEHLMYVPFTDVIITPKTFSNIFGEKQIYFDSYMELCYLHKKYFKQDLNIREKLGLKANEKYIILRFVSWNASHDISHSGLKNEMKLRIIELFRNEYKIFISSEDTLPEHLVQYKLRIDPAELHSVLAGASLYVGEGSTTASECSILGVPNIYVNSIIVGNCKEQEEKYNICFNLRDDEKLIPLMNELLQREDILREWKIKKERMLEDKIDVTAFMVWFVEQYPQSFRKMKQDPNYQLNFTEKNENTVI